MAQRKDSPTPALDALKDTERAVVLTGLLRKRPELAPVAEEFAVQILTDVSADAIADDLTRAITNIPFEDLTARTGRHLWGYVEPHEAACELIDRTIDPYLADLRRLATLNHLEAATATAAGILTGLRQVPEPAEGSVLAYAGPDTLHHTTEHVIDIATGLGLQVPSSP
jgi:hypothetical protein